MTFKEAFFVLIKTPAAIALHLALLVIVAGAFITHFYGVQGQVTLEKGGVPVDRFTVTSGQSDGRFPFGLSLSDTEIVYYPNTTTPSDYASVIEFRHSGDGVPVVSRVSMNNIAEYNGWRFYQTGIAPGSSTLTVAHDPFGIAVTYTGYAMLGVAMLWLLASRRTRWRAVVGKAFAGRAVAIGLFLLSAGAVSADGMPRTLQRPLAREFGKLLVYHDGRICPLRTFAVEFTESIYGSSDYEGLTPEQVLTGWLFYYDDWKREPVIKVKGSKVKQRLGVDGNHAALTDFFDGGGYKLSDMLADRTDRAAIEADSRVALISSVATGAAFRMFPYRSTAGVTEWLSWVDRRPSAMERSAWEPIETALPRLTDCIHAGKNIAANEILQGISRSQHEYLGANGGGGVLERCRAEMFYIQWVRLFPLALALLIVGMAGIVACGSSPRWVACRRWPFWLVNVLVSFLAVYIISVLCVRAYVTGHLPMASGHETMLLMCAIGLVGALVAARRFMLVKCGLVLVAGLSLLVAAMSGRSPQMGALLPVLSSPWLCIHVMLVMSAYALCALMAVLSAVSVVSGNGDVKRHIAMIDASILLPAVFLLAAGIFTGAVWANQSWGRYWGWDPKETCALVTLLVYALPLHSRSIKAFGRSRPLSIYLLLAFLSVLFTYFGANYLIPGLHSYA